MVSLMEGSGIAGLGSTGSDLGSGSGSGSDSGAGSGSGIAAGSGSGTATDSGSGTATGSAAGSEAASASTIFSTATSTSAGGSGSGSISAVAGFSTWRGFWGFTALAPLRCFQGLPLEAAFSAAVGSPARSSMRSSSSLRMTVTNTWPFLKAVTLAKSVRASQSARTSAQPRSSGQMPSASRTSATRAIEVCLPTPSSRPSSRYRYRALPAVIFAMVSLSKKTRRHRHGHRRATF